MPSRPSDAPAASETERTCRRGPGWGALVGVALAVALVAGHVGGILGGFLADRGTPATPAAHRRPAPAPAPRPRPNGSIANIAATATPSVVTLRVEGADGDGTGSGWVYDDRGHIVTNNHVVAGAADGGDITVVLANGQQLEGSIVGRDSSYDLAVVKVDRTDLAPLALGLLRRRRRRRPGDRGGCTPRARLHRDVGHRQRPQPSGHAGRGRRPVLHQRHPDRRRDQPRQLGRARCSTCRAGSSASTPPSPGPPARASAARAATSASASRSRAPRSRRP